MKEIPLTQGKVALVSDEDYDRIAAYKWYAGRTGRGKYWYAMRGAWVDGKDRQIYMHREILGLKPGEQGDHIDGDGLNNTRENLRKATHMQNCWNTQRRQPGPSGFLGVSPGPSGGWIANIINENQQFYLGTYETAEDAACAYDAKARELRGPFARCNFPDEMPAPARREHIHVPSPQFIMAGAILNSEQVAEARRRYIAGGVLIRELAAEYGVKTSAMGHALRGHTFADVTDPPPIRIDKRTARFYLGFAIARKAVA